MLDIIYNPIGGKGKSSKTFKQIKEILDSKSIDYTIHETQKVGHATEIVTELNSTQEHTDLVVLGGDGTFNEVLNGITDFSKITLGLIPCGTGNDFARAAGISTDPQIAIQSILANQRKYIDYLQVGKRRALNCAGAGMDVDVLEKYSEMKAFHGKIKYYISLLSVLLKAKFHKARVTVDGVTSEKSVFLITAGNGIYIGGGMPISPNSVIDDGYITLVVVNEIKKRKILDLLLKFLNGGKHILESCTEEFFVKECRIEILDEGCIELDGELFKEKVLDCKVVSNELCIFRGEK